MPFTRITLKPGVDTQKSPTLNRGGYSASQLIRFMEGQPQKIGGWQQLGGVAKFVGTCTGLHGWASLAGVPLLAGGTEQRLFVVVANALADITPIYATNNPAVAFSTTNGSTSVEITDATTSPSMGDWINLIVVVSVGGLVLSGFYLVSNVIDATHYTVTAASAATATVSGGGAVPSFATVNTSSTVTVTLANHGLTTGALFNVAVSTAVGGVTLSGSYAVTVLTANTFTIQAATAATSSTSGSENGGNTRIEYLIHSGSATSYQLDGYGAGNYGAGDYGLANQASLWVYSRVWSLDHFGQDLIASYRYGPIYYWSPPTPAPAMVVSSTAPTQCMAAFVMSQTEILIAAGAESGGTLYPTLVRWSDSGDFTDWTPSATNQAGSFQIPSGSKVVSGLSIGLAALIWTDVDLWSMTYQGLPFVFDFNRVGVACETLSLRAAVVVSGETVVWPSQRGFYRFDGSSVSPLPCPVWDYLFENMDYSQNEQMFGGSNTLFNEIWWFFPRAGQGMGYVKWNFVENSWDIGSLDRTAWVDHSPMGNPIGADSTGLLQQHETGTDANGSPLAWSFTTGYSDMQDGDEYSFVDMVIPDFVGTYTSASLTIYGVDNPNGQPRTYGPFALTPQIPYSRVRVRARQIALEISGDDLGSTIRLGQFRVRTATAGRR